VAAAVPDGPVSWLVSRRAGRVGGGSVLPWISVDAGCA
jgi:hypothetical protein